MQRFLSLGVALAALFALACASGQFRLLQRDPTPPGVQVEAVRSLVCRGEANAAKDYVQLRGGSLADQVERIEEARRWAADHVSECPCYDGGCKPAPVPAGGVR